jgi:hypothetical protein
METSMPGLRLSPAKLAVAAAAGLMLLSGASYAQSGYGQQLYHTGAYGLHHSQTRAQYPYQGFSPTDNFSSSHICVNGYRWMTRNIDPNASPAQNAIPVPCN